MARAAPSVSPLRCGSGSHKLRAGRAPRDGKAPPAPPGPISQPVLGPQSQASRGVRGAAGAACSAPCGEARVLEKLGLQRKPWGPTARIGEALRNKQVLGISLLLPSAVEGKRNQVWGRHHPHPPGTLESWKDPHCAGDLPWPHLPKDGKEKHGLHDPPLPASREHPRFTVPPAGDGWQELEQGLPCDHQGLHL